MHTYGALTALQNESDTHTQTHTHTHNHAYNLLTTIIGVPSSLLLYMNTGSAGAPSGGLFAHRRSADTVQVIRLTCLSCGYMLNQFDHVCMYRWYTLLSFIQEHLVVLECMFLWVCVCVCVCECFDSWVSSSCMVSLDVPQKPLPFDLAPQPPPHTNYTLQPNSTAATFTQHRSRDGSQRERDVSLTVHFLYQCHMGFTTAPPL